MTALFAIAKLTFKAALRSHVFQALLFLLALGVVLVPNTVKGDGTAYGFVQVSIDYSIWCISLILSMSAVWVGCSVLSYDIENGQLHMVVTKPVSRVTVFLGKLLGVLFLHASLMFIAAFGAYLFVQMQFSWQKFSPEERARVMDEIMAGRRAYYPDRPDIEARVASEFAAKAKTASNLSGKTFDAISVEDKRRVVSELRREIIGNLGEVKPGPENTKYWDFSGLPDVKTGYLNVRYKIFSGSAESKDQKISYGIWGARAYIQDRTKAEASTANKALATDESKPKLKEIYALRSDTPERILCGAPLEFKIPAQVVINDGKARLGFTNLDPENKTLFVQDGPKLLIKNCNFLENFMRAVFVAFLRVAAMAGIACAAGAIFSMPVAVFMVISYLGIGFFSSFLIGVESTYGANPSADFIEKFGLVASKVAMLGVMPLQKFEVSDKLANGELIELSFIAKLFFECIVLKGVPLCALGAWLYWRRELALSLKR